jgi:hypothetical protein
MGVRLRYLGHELEVPEGEFVIGRSSKCQLSIDDPMVSRQHAVLIVRGGRAIVDDLGSRNGVLVNGTRVKGTQRLVEGDRLTIGSQEMVISGLSANAPSRDMAAVTQRFELHETIAGLTTSLRGRVHGAWCHREADRSRSVEAGARAQPRRCRGGEGHRARAPRGRGAPARAAHPRHGRSQPQARPRCGRREARRPAAADARRSCCCSSPPRSPKASG